MPATRPITKPGTAKSVFISLNGAKFDISERKLDFKRGSGAVNIKWELSVPLQRAGWSFDEAEGINVIDGAGEFPEFDFELNGSAYYWHFKNVDAGTYKYSVKLKNVDMTLIWDPTITNEGDGFLLSNVEQSA